MIGNLNHVAIVVPDLKAAAEHYQTVLGADISEPADLPDHGVTTIFVSLTNTKIELLHPLGDNSPIARFLERNPDGGIHHLCLEVDDIQAASEKLQAAGVRILGSGQPREGAHGKPVLFLHPKDFHGVLMELEEKQEA